MTKRGPLNFGPIPIVFPLGSSHSVDFSAIDGEVKNIHPPEGLGQPKNFGCYCLSFLHCKEVAWYVDLDFFFSSCWLNLQVHNLFRPLNNTMFFSEQCGYPAAKTLQKTREKQRQSWGGKFMKIECLIVQFRHHCHHLASDMDVRLKIRYPLIHWLVITFCMNRVIYSPKSLYSIRNNCQWWLSRKSRWFPTFSHKHITMLGSSGFFAVSCFCWGVRKSSKAQRITWATQIHGQDWICLVLIMKTRDTNIKWNIQ